MPLSFFIHLSCIVTVIATIWRPTKCYHKQPIDFNRKYQKTTATIKVDRGKRKFVHSICFSCRYPIDRCETGISFTNQGVAITLSLGSPPNCQAPRCRENAKKTAKDNISKSNAKMAFTLRTTDGQTFDVVMDLCSLIEIVPGM